MNFDIWLQERLTLPLPGYPAQRNMMNVNRIHIYPTPGNARQSGVLLLIYPVETDWELVLIERSQDGGIHSGQVAFPGGRMEPEDIDIRQTALREAHEEINLDPREVKLLGPLTPLYIPVSNFEVHPVVVCSSALPPNLKPSDREVARILHFSFREIFPRKEAVEVRASGLPVMVIRTPAYILGHEQVIWGATAMILSELEALWQEWLQGHDPTG